MSDFRCPRPDCGHTWSMKPDRFGLFDGYGNPPCPLCGTSAVDPSDFGDWECPHGHTWRTYGNGGLTLGMVPRCPDHHVLPISA